MLWFDLNPRPRRHQRQDILTPGLHPVGSALQRVLRAPRNGLVPAAADRGRRRLADYSAFLQADHSRFGNGGPPVEAGRGGGSTAGTVLTDAPHRRLFVRDDVRV